MLLSELNGFEICQVDELMKLIVNRDSVSTLGSKVITVAHGDLFYATYKSQISDYLVTVAGDFVPALMKHVSSQSNMVGNVILGMLDAVVSDATLRHK